MDIEGKRVLVVGWARSGRAVADFFRRRGSIVTVSDARPPWEFASEIPSLLSQRMGLEFGAHREETFLRQDLVVASPGVPWGLPALAAARAHGIPVVPEVEAAGWFLQGTLVGVTGSNGKTTTTTLLGKMLEASGFSTFLGGNIGVPLISAAEHASPDAMVVAELSSFQLEAIQTLRPHVAVLLNVTPNHLDRHPTFEAYLEAKARIFRNQTASDYAVLNADDDATMSLAPRIPNRQILFSLRQDLLAGVLVSGSDVLYRVNHLERVLFSTRDLKLRGDFNLEDALAASAAACVLGADFDAVARAVREFRGVEHRLEWVRQIGGVDFYNDSKATSVDATAKALSAFERGVHLILGGKDKGAPYAPLKPLLKGRVREVLLIGAAADRIAQELSGEVDLRRAGDLETATRTAFDRAASGDTVLLAPACSSYDQFENFEHRGRAFKEIVMRLAQEFAVGARALRTDTGRPAATKPAGPTPAAAPPVESPKMEALPTGAPEEASEPPAVAGSSAHSPVVDSGATPEWLEASPPYTTPMPETSGAPGPDQPQVATPLPESGEPPAPEAGLEAAVITEEPEAGAPRRPELVYVYEVDAEALAPMDLDLVPDEPESASREAAQTEDRPAQNETIDSGQLLFEVAPPSVAAPDEAAQPAGDAPESALEAGAKAETGRQRRRRRPRSTEGSEGSEPGSSNRLPGL